MTTTIQRTSKPLKALKLLANLIQIFGILFMVTGVSREANDMISFGFWTLLAGIGLHLIAQALIWWFHE